jgi:hypothetical protein
VDGPPLVTTSLGTNSVWATKGPLTLFDTGDIVLLQAPESIEREVETHMPTFPSNRMSERPLQTPSGLALETHMSVICD